MNHYQQYINHISVGSLSLEWCQWHINPLCHGHQSTDDELDLTEIIVLENTGRNGCTFITCVYLYIFIPRLDWCTSYTCMYALRILYIYIYIHICIQMCTCVRVYIYTHVDICCCFG